MKKHIVTFFIFLTLQVLNAKDTSVFLKQVELEKIYTSKVTNFLDKMFDASDYYVFADVQLVEKAKVQKNELVEKAREKSNELKESFLKNIKKFKVYSLDIYALNTDK